MRKLIALALAVAATLLFAPIAGAQQTSRIFVVHGIPGATVDVYVNGALTLGNFTPGTVAGPLELPAGSYDIRVIGAGEDPATATPVIDVAGAAVPGGANISLVAHLSAAGAPTLGVFPNDVATIPAGQGKVTVRHTAAAPAVDIVLDGAPVTGLTNLANGGQATVTLPVGNYNTGIAAAGTTEVLLPAPATVTEGTNTIVYAVGSLEAGTVQLVVQTITGLHTPPAAVPTGNSGLAADSGGSGTAVAGAAAAAMVVAMGTVLALRRRAAVVSR